MEVFWIYAGIGLLVFLALAGVSLIILASGNRKT
jgi:hypothetical protein